MLLYFSDWTTPQNLEHLKKNGFLNAERLIKVFASRKDPSAELGRKITIVESESDPFDPNIEFKYPGRGPWLGSDMEVYLSHFHLTDDAKQKARALFRFAQSPEMEIIQLAMSIRNAATRDYHYHHPLAIIDGLDEAAQREGYHGLHLDIFTQRSIEHLAKIIKLENTEGLVTIRESVELTKTTPEGSPSPTKESH